MGGTEHASLYATARDQCIAHWAAKACGTSAISEGAYHRLGGCSLITISTVVFRVARRELKPMSTPTNYPHIETRADGKVWLIGTQTKVIEVALDRLAHHWDADEIQRQHPHLTLGQIHSCLAYYHDHEEEMDQAIEEQLRGCASARATR